MVARRFRYPEDEIEEKLDAYRNQLLGSLRKEMVKEEAQ